MDAASALTFGSAFFALVLGGVYLAFDVMVMPALRRRPSAEAIAAMQEINRRALRPGFMLLFFGSALLAVAATVAELLAADGATSPTRVIGNALVFLAFVLTIAVNVPRNNAIEALDPAASAGRWPALERVWSIGNRLRLAVALTGAAVLFATLRAPAFA